MKTILITGKPGTGKSTLVRKIQEKLDINEKHECRINGKKYTYYKKDNYYILGKYEKNVYPGIDSLPKKSGIVDLIDMIENEDKNAVIICEGWIFKKYDYDKIYWLDASDDIVRERFMYRRNNINKHPNPNAMSMEEYLIVWEKRKNSIIKNYGPEVLIHNTEQETNDNLNKIINYMQEK